jgi:hypothetical protein
MHVFLGCIRPSYPVNPKHILAGGISSLASLGDFIYNYQNFYRGASDSTPQIGYLKNGSGASVQFGAAVNGQLPAGAAGTGVVGGSGYPTGTMVVTLTGSGGNTAYGTATFVAGALTGVTLASANNFGGGIGGYNNAGVATFTIDDIGTSAYVLRQILNAWSTVDKYNLLIAPTSYKKYAICDDHEWSDNCDWTVTKLNSQFGGGIFSSAADVGQYYLKQQTGLASFITAYTDVPAWRTYGGDVPAALVGTLTSGQILIKDFYIDFDDNGAVVGTSVAPAPGGTHRHYYTDSVGSKSPLGDPDDGTPGTNGVVKTMYGAGQKARFLAAAQDATNKGIFFVWCSSKDKYNVDNGDGDYVFSFERDAILTALDAMGCSYLVVTSDRHNMHASHAYKADGAAYDVEVLCGCPTATETMGMTPYAQNDWMDGRPDSTGFTRVYWDSSARTMYAAIVDHNSGDILKAIAVPMGSRKASMKWVSHRRPYPPLNDLNALPTEQMFTLLSTGSAPAQQFPIPLAPCLYANLPAVAAVPTNTRIRVLDVGTKGSWWYNRGDLWFPDGPITVTGTPLGVVVAPVGSIAVRTDGGAATSFYVKESGTGASTGWVAK